jgi:rare lipoprotein A
VRVCQTKWLCHPFSTRMTSVIAAIALSGVLNVGGPPSWAARLNRRVQTGFATYYGRAFQGRTTASGERFNRHALVAAHPSLPFDTVVRVTNLKNGRSVRVRIVDRGPYGQNRREGTIIDLSTAAARRIDMIRDGQVRVRLEILTLRT